MSRFLIASVFIVLLSTCLSSNGQNARLIFGELQIMVFSLQSQPKCSGSRHDSRS